MKTYRGIKSLLLFIGIFLSGEICLAQNVPLLEWAKSFGGNFGEDASATKVDASGNVYVTGFFVSAVVDFDPGPATFNLSSSGSTDIFISKFDPTGNLVWARALGGSSDDVVQSLALDNSGNVYITGYFNGTVDFDPGAGIFNFTSAGSADAFILKLNTDGDFVWAGQIGGTQYDQAFDIDVDDSGNVYATGYFLGTADFDPGAGTVNLTADDQDVFAMKLDNAGNFQWAKKFGSLETDRGRTLTIDGAGNVIITGGFYGYTVPFDFDPGPATATLTPNTTPGQWDIYVMKLNNTNGDILWAKSIAGSLWDIDEAITVDNLDNILLTGYFEATTDFDPGAGVFELTAVGSSNPYIVKLNSAGDFVWAKSFANASSTGSPASGGNAISADASGNIYASGAFQRTVDFDPGPSVFNLVAIGQSDAYISKLDANGNFVWAFTIGSANSESARGIALTSTGDVYIAGAFSLVADFDPGACSFNLTSNGNIDAFIQKITFGTPAPGPTISSFSPASGPIGTPITITGTDFSATPANNDVRFFNNQTAIVSASTPTSINTTVPASANTGRISVTHNCITVQSATDFVVTSSNFITRWNLATAGSGATQLSFGTATSGVVNYTWQEISPGSASGSGSWSGTTLTITGLPAGAIIRLQIEPTNFQRININLGTNRNRLTQVEQWGSTAWTSMQNAFRGCVNLQVTATDVPNLSGVADMSAMFANCSSLNSPSNIGAWNTSGVTNMSSLFSLASGFNQNISSWNTAAVTNMSGLFSDASAFNQDIGAWNTAAVTNMGSMFSGALVFNRNIGAWNTGAVTNMVAMFFSAYAFNQNISGWNTAAVTNMASMFGYAHNFNQNIGIWNTSAVTNMSRMFEDAFAFNQNIGTWNTSAVTTMRGMFIDAYAFNQNIGSWNTSAVTNMERMFDFATAFNQNIGLWNTAAVTDMRGMFANASAFNQNIGTWSLNAGVLMTGMLNNCNMNCNNYSSTIIGWSNSPSSPNSRALGATGRQYGTDAVAARSNLVTNKLWTITGDTPSGAICTAPLPLPAIASFSPSSGAVGTSVTIIGTNFSTTPANNVVYFGATKAIVTAATATQLTVTVPTGATYQPISVLVNGLTAFSSKPFSVTFAGGGIIDNCSFSPFTGLTAGLNPYNVSLGDLDGDGKSDFVTADNSDNTISVFRNISTPGSLSTSSFAAKVIFSTGTGPLGVVIQDLDGDSKPEIIVTNSLSNTISIFRNTSVVGTINASSFAAKIDFVTGNHPHDLTVSDFDADGKPDLAVSNTLSSSVSVFKNTSVPGAITSGSFAAKVDFTTGSGPQGIASRDLDGDGRVDMVVANESDASTSILRNTSITGVINASSFATKVDFTTGPNPTDVAIADLDGDDKPDLAISNADDGSLSIFKNTATSGAVDVSSFSADVGFFAGGGYASVIDDIDGDGKPDLLANSDPDHFVVLKNETAMGGLDPFSFASPLEFATSSNIDGIAIGDLDGDGRPDVVATGGTSGISILRNTIFSTPTIAGFAPASGVAGTTIMITGTNFSTTPVDNIVKFNGTDAVVTAATSTTLTTIVPFSATTGTLTITLGCNTATTTSNFTVSVIPTDQHWVKKIGASDSQGGAAIGIDGSGSSYTAGYFSGTTDFDPGSEVYELTALAGDGFVVKLDAIGNFVWAKRIGGTGNDFAHAIQIDPNGNIYLAGTFTGTTDFDPGAATFNLTASGSREIFIMKLDNNGLFSWAKQIGGSGIDELSSLAIDASGNLYATGYFYGTSDFDPGLPVVNLTSAGGADAYLLKLNSDGDFVWVKQIGSSGLDVSNAITVSSAGNPHITGYFEGTVDFDPGAGINNLVAIDDNDIFIAKFLGNGDFAWAKSIGSNSYEHGYALTTDASENVYTSGNYHTITDFDPGSGTFELDPAPEDEDGFVLKLDATGNFIWATKFGGPFGGTTPQSIAIDNAANTYIIGEVFHGDDGSQIIMAGFDSDGNQIFKDIAPGFGSGRSIGVSTTGDLYATGEFSSMVDFNLGTCLGTHTSDNDDIFILKTRANAFVTPTITSFSPSSGSEGTSVIITGLNFNATASQNLVDFGGVPAIVTASTTSTITTTVPAGASTEKITISTGCGIAISNTDFIVSNDLVITVQPTDNSVCDGQPATFASAATGTINITYQWQYSPDGITAFADIADGVEYSGATSATLSVNTDGSFGGGLYRCYVSGDLATSVTTNEAELSVQAIPSAPLTTPAARCGDGAVTLTALGGASGQYRWYTAPSGGTSITSEVNDAYTSPVLSVTTTYYTSIVNGSCESERTPVVATVTSIPPVLVTGASACPGNTLTLNASGGNNGQYKWYADATTSQPIAGESNNSYTTPVLNQTTTYFVSVSNNNCESSRTPVTATILTSGCAPEIETTALATVVEGTIVIDLKPLITTTGTLDVNSIKVTVAPESGAIASIENGILTITYTGVNFGGSESITIEACNTNGLCGQQDFTIEVNGDIVIYNAVSPNDDGKNEFLILQYIDALPSTKTNTVSIYNRWGDEVFTISDYDNTTRVFSGRNKDGNKLPSGTYYYKIVFPLLNKSLTGFLSVKY